MTDDDLRASLDFAEIDDDVANQEYQMALGALLLDGAILIGDNWWRVDRLGEISVNVICSDTFGYACADCEELPYKEIGNVYRLWRRDPKMGITAWCVAHRKERPITEVVKMLVAAGYDVDALIRGKLPVVA